MSFLNSLKNTYSNIPGWRTNRKIIVIESDDWGGLRIRSKKDYQILRSKNIISDNVFNKYDSLENNHDLECLFETLTKFKDKHGQPLKITANFVVTNPDFERIKNDKFENYYFESFIQSYEKYNMESNTFSIVKEGIENKYFYPQFHGREHLQVEFWMRDLKLDYSKLIEGFNHDFFAFSRNEVSKYSYLSSFLCLSNNDIIPVRKRISEGLEMFNDIFGYNSVSLIAPENTIHPNLLEFTSTLGIKAIQGSRVNKEGKLNSNDKGRKRRFMGLKNRFKQIDIVRNVIFEPCASNIDWVSKSLREMENAFFWKKPVVICSHRFNYIGKLAEDNRKKGLNSLKQLIFAAQQKWPEIEFMTTEELYNVILHDKL